MIYDDTTIGKKFQTGNKANIRGGCRIGDNVSVGTLAVIEHHVTIGDNVRIHSQAFIPEFTELGRDSWIGPNVVFTNAKYPKSQAVKESLRGALVLEGAKIGANVTILPGVVIGRNSLVGAGAVVVRDVPDGAVVVGNPGRAIGRVDPRIYPDAGPRA